MSAPRRHAAAAVLAGVTLASGTACSVGVTGSGGSPASTPDTAAAGPSAAAPSATSPVGAGDLGSLGAGASSAAGAVTGKGLPAGFPLPSGVTVADVAVDGKQIAGTLAVPDARRAYAYWTSALPAAGYTVTAAQQVGGTGEIRFRGHGCVGNSQIAVTSPTTAVECDLA